MSPQKPHVNCRLDHRFHPGLNGRDRSVAGGDRTQGGCTGSEGAEIAVIRSKRPAVLTRRRMIATWWLMIAFRRVRRRSPDW